MVKLFSVSVVYKTLSTATLLKSEHEVSSFSFFQRSSVQEGFVFLSQIVAERTQPGQRQSVKENECMCHVYIRDDRLGAVLLSDLEYPRRVAFTMLSKLCEDFASKVPSKDWSANKPAAIQYEELPQWLSKYQNPNQADAMSRVQSELDETKIILHNTMESLLNRGEKLDDLVSKSDQLSLQSKTFYKQAKKTNQWCCVIQ